MQFCVCVCVCANTFFKQQIVHYQTVIGMKFDSEILQFLDVCPQMLGVTYKNCVHEMHVKEKSHLPGPLSALLRQICIMQQKRHYGVHQPESKQSRGIGTGANSRGTQCHSLSLGTAALKLLLKKKNWWDFISLGTAA